MKPSAALLHKMRSIIRCNRGESLIEGIVSILVFTVLVATITTMMMLAIRFSRGAIERSDEMQDSINALALFNPADRLGTDNIVFNFIDSGGNPITMPLAAGRATVDIYSSDDFIVFEPQ